MTGMLAKWTMSIMEWRDSKNIPTAGHAATEKIIKRYRNFPPIKESITIL
jgi:hypothetical protein